MAKKKKRVTRKTREFKKHFWSREGLEMWCVRCGTRVTIEGNPIVSKYEVWTKGNRHAVRYPGVEEYQTEPWGCSG